MFLNKFSNHGGKHHNLVNAKRRIVLILKVLYLISQLSRVKILSTTACSKCILLSPFGFIFFITVHQLIFASRKIDAYMYNLDISKFYYSR